MSMIRRSSGPVLSIKTMTVLLLNAGITSASEDSSLVLEWRRTYGGPGNDQGWSIRQTRDDGYIVAGNTESFDDGRAELYLLKLDSNGDLEWEKHYPELSRANQVRETTAGFVIAGWQKPLARGAALLVTDAAGESPRLRVYGGEDAGSMNSVLQTGDGGFLATGYLGSFATTIPKMYVVKTDSNLNVAWEHTYEDAKFITGNNVIPLSNGNFLAVGRSHDSTTRIERMCLLQFDIDGNTIWNTRAIGNVNSFYNEGWAVFEEEKAFVVLGSTIPFFDATPGLYVATIDGQGVRLKDKSFSGASNSEGLDAFCRSSNGGYVLAQYAVSKILPGGGVSCVLNSSGITGGRTVTESRDGGLVVAGQVAMPGRGLEVVVFKLFPERPFVRGDGNHDGLVDISDGIFLLKWLYTGGSGPNCGDAADANDDCTVDIADAVRIFEFLFLGEGEPLSPFPSPGMDPTPDVLGCRIGYSGS